MTDSNIYCQGNLLILRDANDTEDYVGGIYFKDSTGQQYCAFYLMYNDFSPNYLILDCVPSGVQNIEGLQVLAYNAYLNSTVPSNILTGNGLQTCGVQVISYSGTPLTIDYFPGVPNPYDFLVLNRSLCTFGSNPGTFTSILGRDLGNQNYGFTGFEWLGDGRTDNGLVLGCSDEWGQNVVAQKIDTTNNVSFLNGLLYVSNYYSAVGVGTVPGNGYKFEVDGDVNITGTFRKNGTDILAGVITDLAPLTLDKINNRIGVNQANPTYSLDVTGTGHTTGDLTVDSNLAVGGNIDLGNVSATLTVDTVNKRVGVVQPSPSYPLDVVGDVNTTTKYKIGGTDVLSVNSGDLVLGGNNVYHTPIEDDLVCTVVPRTGTATLANINSTGVYAYAFSAAGTSEVSFVCQLSHKWQEGSDITPHFHWCPETTNVGNCVFKLDYWITNIGENIPASVTTLTQTVAAGGTAYTHKLCSFGAVSAVGKTASCLFGGRLYRDGNSGSDTFTGNAYILSVDLHVKNNRLGLNI